jgi:hypothetical protein
VVSFCEHGNEASGSIKVGDFVDWLTVSFSQRMLPWSYCSSQSSRFSVHSAQISVCHFLFLSLHCNVGYLFPLGVGIRIVL